MGVTAYGLTFVDGFSRQYHSCSTLRVKFGAVPDQETSRVISLNFPPEQRSGFGKSEGVPPLPDEGMKLHRAS